MPKLIEQPEKKKPKKGGRKVLGTGAAQQAAEQIETRQKTMAERMAEITGISTRKSKWGGK